MAKKAKEHKFGTMDTAQSEHAWGAFVKFWVWCAVVSFGIIAMFLSLVL